MNANDLQVDAPVPVHSEWRHARRVLAVRLDNLGDVLVTTPAIHAIRESLPDASITLLASPVGAQAGRLNPDVDEVVVYNAPWMDPWSRLPLDPTREMQTIAQLSAGRYDAAVIFSSFRQSPLPAAYLCYLAGIPLRLAASIDGPGSLLTTRHRHPERMMHEVERGLDLVAAVGMGTSDDRLVLRVPDGVREEITALVTDQRPLIVVHPGCSMPARTYPWEQYVEVIDALVRDLSARVVLTGADDERPLVDTILAHVEPWTRTQVMTAAGSLAFPAFCALVEAADVVVTNNTGPMHMAAALGTPVVALFALTNPPEQWGPWRVPHRMLWHEVPCRLCYSRVCPTTHDCLREVRPRQVVEAVADLLARAILPRRPGNRPRPNRCCRDRIHERREPLACRPEPACGPARQRRRRRHARSRIARDQDHQSRLPDHAARLTGGGQSRGAPALARLRAGLEVDLAGPGATPIRPRPRERTDSAHRGAFVRCRGDFQRRSARRHMSRRMSVTWRGFRCAPGNRRSSGELPSPPSCAAHPTPLIKSTAISISSRRLGSTKSIPRWRLRSQTPAGRRSARRLWNVGITPDQPLVILHPGASAAARRYPAARFGQVADLLLTAGLAARRHRLRAGTRPARERGRRQ